MGEAKQKNAKHLEAQDRSQREDAMHKRAQRAEGDLLKARAHITQLEAEAREARAELAAEKALADDLYIGSRGCANQITAAWAAYRKARGL